MSILHCMYFSCSTRAYLLTVSLYFLTTFTHLTDPPLIASINYQSVLSMSVLLSFFTYKWDYMVVIIFCLTSHLAKWP